MLCYALRNTLGKCEARLLAGGQHFKSLVQRKVYLTAGEQRTRFPKHAGLCDAPITAAVFRDIKKHFLYIMIQHLYKAF